MRGWNQPSGGQFSVINQATNANANTVHTSTPDTTPVGLGHPAVAALNALLGVKETASV
jgi:hypothetical protein